MLERRNNPSVVNALRDARLSRGLTERELAIMAECNPATIAAIEDGEYAPSVSLALRLAWTLGCSVEQLFSPPPRPPKVRGWSRQNDERNTAIYLLSYLIGFSVFYDLLITYAVARTLFGLREIAKPQDAFFHSLMTVLSATQIFYSEKCAKKAVDRFPMIRRVFWGGGTLFFLAQLGDDFGLTMLQVLITLSGIIAVAVWTLVIREVVRNRRPARLHESYGDG